MLLQGYKFLFKTNFSDGKNAATIQISIHAQAFCDKYASYEVVCRMLKQYVSGFEGKLSLNKNGEKPEPTLENIGEEFYSDFSKLLALNGLELVRLELSDSTRKIVRICRDSLTPITRHKLDLAISRIQQLSTKESPPPVFRKIKHKKPALKRTIITLSVIFMLMAGALGYFWITGSASGFVPQENHIMLSICSLKML